MLILEFNRARATAALNILNFFWGAGAIICSLFVYSLARTAGLIFPTAVLAASLSAVAVFLALMSARLEQKPTETKETSEDFAAPIWTQPVAWVIAFFNLIHVGFESGMGGWLVTYTERLSAEMPAWWLSPIFLYFLFFVIGRGIAPLFSRFLDENKLLLLGLLTILLGMFIVLAAKDVLLLGVGASVSGFGTSWIFPTNVSRFTKIFGATASRRATPLFICGTLGGAATTWLIGFVSNHFGGLRSGMFLLLAGVLILIVLQIFLMFRKPKKDAPPVNYSHKRY
jgi:fucose permease